jgi:hypothetical protein
LLNYLLNDKLNAKLAPFINLGKLGFNFGIQGIQFTATSTVAENQTLSTSSYIHSIPNNNDNQDIVSMGANAALIASKVIENTFEVCSIELIAVLQAIDSLKIQDKLSSFNKDTIVPAISSINLSSSTIDASTIFSSLEFPKIVLNKLSALEAVLGNFVIDSKHFGQILYPLYLIIQP